MSEIDTAALEAVREDIQDLAEATSKVEIQLANKRAELMLPIFEKRRAIIAKIPKFWSVVCQNHEAMGAIMSADDIPILDHLTDIWVQHDTKDSRNYTITFTFKENPYFTDKELVKKITIKDDDEAVAESTKIHWKEGKNVTLKRKNDAENESFFSFFEDDDATLADYIAHDMFTEAFAVYVNDDSDGEFDDSESVDLDDDEEDEEEQKPQKKSKK
ncbi:hypothetical protein BGZ70_009212 [Mortierella alpina]|uniref:Template-activating factor I n=1 Tax=Mortierella alpina TaxID=64518 RepID=A0A9P6JDR1_MORAP|nr:hypothetical protein BGZ70_009212 [Mortierella alpina]